MSLSDQLSTVSSFRSLDTWLKLLAEQSKGSVLPGFKATRPTFGGGSTSTTFIGSPGLRQIPETSMAVTQNIDFSQGDIVASHLDTHYAINGDGFFAVAKSLGPGERVLFTRDGEFHKDDTGHYRDSQGNYLLNPDDIDPMGLVTRDPVRFGRPFPSPLEPFPPGATGITDANINGSYAIAGNWIDPLVGGGPFRVNTSNMTNFDGGLPAGWSVTAPTAGFNDTAFGGPNASGRSVGWGASAFGANASAKGLYYGDQTSGTNYSTGVEAAKTLDYMIDWDPSNLSDMDIKVTEAGGGVVSGKATPSPTFYANGYLNRDQLYGFRPGTPTTSYDMYDEWYHLDTQKAVNPGTGTTPNFTYWDDTFTAPSYTGGAVNQGGYRLDILNSAASSEAVNWQVVEDAGTFREQVQSGTTGALAPGATANVMTKGIVDRSNRGSVTSKVYTVTGEDQGLVRWDQKALVESLGAVDNMTFEYSVDGGAWVSMDAKTLAMVSGTANDGNWHKTQDIMLPTLTGKNTVQFRWDFDTIDSKQNNTFGWAIDNFELYTTKITNTSKLNFTVYDPNASGVGPVINAGDKIQLVDSSGVVQGSTTFAGSPGAGGITVAIPVTDNAFPVPSKWPFTNATVQIIDGATGNVKSSHVYADVECNATGTVYLDQKRGFMDMVYADPKDNMQTSVAGLGFYENKKFTAMPTFKAWNATGSAKLLQNALEGSNASQPKIGEELVAAQRMYDGLTKVLMAHKEITLALIDAIR